MLGGIVIVLTSITIGALLRCRYWHEHYKEEVKEKWRWRNEVYRLTHGTSERYYD